MASRVGIAFDDVPLEVSPTWTWIDVPGGDFPNNFVSGYDIKTGRQTLIAQTDTGTGTVYINDFKYGLFDPNNSGSPYFGKLLGKQILLQLYDPVRAVWEPQFRGTIDNISWDIDANTTGGGLPVNASIQLECVDFMDYLAGYGLTPGLAGVEPAHLPHGMTLEAVWYAETSGSVDGRIIEIVTDATSITWVASMLIPFTGNVAVQAVKYDPDEPALSALRDACDAEIPWIANFYVARVARGIPGPLVFHGRYSRFVPDDVAANANAGIPDTWNFTRWGVGDGVAVLADPTRTQIRVLSYNEPRADLINIATAYPANIKPADMPGQVKADTTSINAYGAHAAQPMSDLIVAHGIVSGGDPVPRNDECFKYAELLVANKKDPREAITALQVKSTNPSNYKAERIWALITQADISDIVNVAVGYPGEGVGMVGASPDDDYYIEGRQMRVRPLQPGYDYVELDLEVSPAVWSMDTHSIFPDYSP